MDPPFATQADFLAKNGEDSYSDRIESSFALFLPPK
jgi:hypothetical protein